MRDQAHKADEGMAFNESFNRMTVNDSSAGGGEMRVGPEGEAAPRTDEEYAQTQLTLRAIVSSKEAGVVIGKGGKNVADLRDETGVKAGVSKVVQGVHDRVLSVTGTVEGVAKAYAIVARGLLEGAPAVGMGGVVHSNGTHRRWPFRFNIVTGIALAQNSIDLLASQISLPSWDRPLSLRRGDLG